MVYTIEISYTTGDSFGSHEETDTVGCIWRDKEQARLALSYIKEHYELYKRTNAWNVDNQTIEEVESIVKEKPWVSDEVYHWQHRIRLPFEDKIKTVSTFWTGYFETLHTARIIVEGDDEDSFSF